ncbi:hypothetical protein [Flexithrix dorotheae]|uniref:hypothetical protein n=1 Tax=Flexithrix dorotheae TaxID=70993 RepID=UPI00035C896D|nr:hypothetical protein [Flexithrix dorotheae]
MNNQRKIIKIWGQDPAESDLGMVNVDLTLPKEKWPIEVCCGGKQIKNLLTVSHPEITDFFNTEQLKDLIHTYGVSLMMLQYGEKLLGKAIKWSWNRKGENLPLLLYPYYDEDINAYYVKEERAVQLCKYGIPPYKKYACRSFDIVAHETAHAIYDALQPAWHDLKTDTEAGAIKEAFCDLCVVFLFLSQLVLCNYILKVTGSDLSKKSVLTTIGEEFYQNRLRDINVLVKYDEVNKSRKYEFSVVFSGGMYEVLANYFQYALEKNKTNNPTMLLMKISGELAKILFFTIANEKEVKPTMALLITQMAGFAMDYDNPILAGLIKESFIRRRVI